MMTPENFNPALQNYRMHDSGKLVMRVASA
jgi:hypothetical protein